MKHTLLSHEIQGYTKQRVFSIKIGILLLVLIGAMAGITYVAHSLIKAQQALEVVTTEL